MYGENKTWVISCNISHSNFLMANMEFMCLMGWRFLSLKLCSRICFVETNVEKCLSEVILNLLGLLCPPESSLLCLSLNLHVFILYRTGWVFYISLWLQSAFVLHLWDKNPFQLASYAVHSTETVLLWLLNDILPSLDVHKLLIFLFSVNCTVNHVVMISRLETVFGIYSTALQWSQSYLQKCFQHVSVLFAPSSLLKEVPQSFLQHIHYHLLLMTYNCNIQGLTYTFWACIADRQYVAT